jgi:lipoyl-dependent peroxiredoxin
MSGKQSVAKAIWQGDLAKGEGRVSGESGGLPSTSVSWAARTEMGRGKTSPEELLAAANASCLCMALSAGLGRIGKPPERLDVTAKCTFDKVGDGWKVTLMELDITGKVPGIDAKAFDEAAKAASAGCPISSALKGNVEFRVSARLG